MRRKLAILLGFLLSLCLVPSGWGQANSVPAAAKAPAVAGANVHSADDPDVLRETQLTINAHGYSGLIWWIPYEFWGRSAAKAGTSPDRAQQTFKVMKDYTVVGLMIAKVSPLGSFDYLPPTELQQKTVIRDASGNDYSAIANVTGDAKTVADLMRPILANAMGRAGENFAMLFFPGKDKTGAQIADAVSKGQFSVVLKDALGEPETIYLWRTPLTAFAPTRYCPVGKERVHANWEYCPWHGVKLTDKP